MKNLLIAFTALFIISCSSRSDNPEPNPTPTPTEDTFVRAADLSFVPEIEAAGISFKNNNSTQDPLLTLKMLE